MNRRNLLKAMPAALAVGAAPAFAAVAPQETPIAALYREWKAADEDLKHPKWDDRPNDEQDAECCRVTEMTDTMLNMPAQTPQDFILKVMAYTYLGEHGLPDHRSAPSLWAEARALVA